MDKTDHILTCAVTAEWCTTQGSVSRKVTHKTANLRLVRNEFQEIFVEITAEKVAPIKIQVKAINVHKKFMMEGKASIKFQDDRCTLFLSNAPPSNLVSFLKMLFIKMTGNKGNDATPSKSIRAQLLSSKPKSFEDISPLTVAEIQNAKNKISKATSTTPSPPTKKRKLRESEGQGPLPKKLYKPTPSATLEEAELNVEQKKVLDACLGGKNVFFTGSAGTGKSFLLRKIISALPPDVTMSTASTGVAACHIGGTTLHNFAGIGGGDATMEKCFQLASKPVVAQKWRKCKHLIIDEISMVDGEYFEKIEEVARHVRKNNKPFGGIQLILCGDFFQLPPVVKQDKNKKRFCFQSIAWEKCIDLTFELQTVHRQKDSQFISILNSIRIGRVTDEITDRLLATAKQKIEGDGILATRLCSHTNDSQIINESKLKQLVGEEKIFTAQDCSPYSTSQLDVLTVAPSKLVLKVGAQVMLLKNISVSSGLVNGARGIVVRFEDGYPVVKFKNKKEFTARTERWVAKTSSGALLARRQIPLNLAWAFSIHKSQGLTLDCVEMSLSKIFEAGQAYVALSRAQSLESLRVLDFNSKQVWANPMVLEFYQKFRRRLQQTEIIPVGKFLTNKNKSNETALAKAKLKMLKMLENKPVVKIC